MNKKSPVPIDYADDFESEFNDKTLIPKEYVDQKVNDIVQISVGTTPPPSPVVDQLWVDTN